MKSIYFRLLYPHVMRLLHRYDWHHMQVSHPEGDTLRWCHWCGLRVMEKPHSRSQVKVSLNEQEPEVRIPSTNDFAVTGKPLKPSWRLRKRELEAASRTKRKQLESFREIT